MKTLNEYLKMPYRMELVEDPDEGGFVVSYPDLPGCITCGETVERAIANAQDAKKHGWKQRWKRGSRSMSRIAWRNIPGSSNCGFRAVCIARLPSIRSERGSA